MAGWPSGRSALVAAVALTVLTALAPRAPWRFEVAVPDLVPNADLSGGTRGWWGTAGVSLRGGRPPAVELRAAGRRTPVFLGTGLPPPDRRYGFLRFTAEVRAEGIEAGARPWERARILMLSQDHRGKRLWYWPAEVVALTGDRPWRRVVRTLPVAAGAASRALAVHVTSDAGSLSFRGLRVDGLRETAAFAATRLLVMALWLALATALAVALAREGPRWTAAATLVYAALLVAGGLSPQPGMRDTLYAARDGAYAARDAVLAATRRLVADRSAPGRPSEGAAASGGGEARPRSGGTGGGDGAHGSAPGTPGGPGASPLSRIGFEHWAPPDRRAHLAAFAGLGLLATVGFRRRRAWQCLAAACVLGGAIESLQGFSATREPEWVDLGADAAGALAGVLAGSLLRRPWRRSG